MAEEEMSRTERYRQYGPKTTPSGDDADIKRFLLPYQVQTEEDIWRASIEDSAEENARPIACACIGCPHEANCQCICPLCHGPREETSDGIRR